jgi:SAM-dependent methyltransferase
MKISQATALIRTPLIEWVRPQDWCDLGCGTGTFTTALAELLVPGSTIHAVDLDQKALEEIPDRYYGVQIRKVLGDLRSSSLRLPSVDGILMARYPVGFAKLCELFNEVGVERVEKLATSRSRFGGTMYSAAAERSRA